MRQVVLPDATRRLLELAGAAALAIGQPVLADLAADPGTFVLRRSTPLEIAALTTLLLVAAPLSVWAIEQVVRRLRPTAVPPLHTAVLALAALVWAVQLAIAGGVARAPAFVLGAVVAVGLAAHAHRPLVRSVLASLAILVPALAIWFLLVSPVAEVARTTGADRATGAVVDGEHPPIVLIVFDELPTLSLLDRTGAIDSERFPAFARLASTSTWYRNHTAMSPWTAYSVPTIVTSTEPSNRLLPVAAHHPDNLFDRLAPTYELHVLEPEWLCADALECHAPTTPGSGLGGLLRDSARLLVERMGPHDDASPRGGNDPGAVFVGEEELALDAPEVLDAFVAGLGRSERPRLDYVHVLAPHQPWRFLPDGRLYGGEGMEGGFMGGWSDDRAGEANRIRHLLQLQWTDAQLGRVLDRLEDLGVLDESLVVVTADHGAAFRGGAPLRASSEATLHEIYWAPLLVKAPGQSRGATIDDPVTALDVLPTMLATAAMPPRPGALGAPLAPRPPAGRGDDRRVWAGASSELVTDGRFATIDGARAFAALFEAAVRNPGHGPFDVFRQGPNGDLVGRRIDALRTRHGALDAAIEDVARFDDVDPDGPTPPGWLSLTLPAGDQVELAIVLNGTVAATPLARVEGDIRRAVAVLPVELLIDGPNRLEVYRVERDGTGRRTLVGESVT